MASSTPTLSIHRGRIIAAFWLAFLAGAPGARAEAGITNQGPFTVFTTGTSNVLTSEAIPVAIPFNFANAQLEFIFGFSTEEPVSLQDFFDSFSITLQNNDDSSNSALLLTADRSGTQWEPSNPGGLTLDPSWISYGARAFPAGITPDLPFDQAFAVTFHIPAEFLNETNTLFLDLFDNQDANRSLAFIYNLHLSLPIFLQSSAAAEGPFADEEGVTPDTFNQILSIPQFSPSRFYRVQSDIPARVHLAAITANDLLFDYRFEPAVLRLQSAPAVTGPYTDDSSAVFDLEAETVTVPRPVPSRFYRIFSDGSVVFGAPRQVGGQLIWNFDFKPKTLRLQSSAQAAGPYSTESGLSIDASARRLRLPKLGGARFFRIRSLTPYRISRVEAQNGQWLIHYQ